MKLTEDEVIQLLIKHLEKHDWTVGDKYCLGGKHGIDIEASKNGMRMLIEAKGAKASDTAPHKKREKFDSGQIKVHFGKALVKVLHDKIKNPDAIVAIAQPDDADVRRVNGDIVPLLKEMGIKHFWVSPQLIIEE
jgi:hypothetical protein